MEQVEPGALINRIPGSVLECVCVCVREGRGGGGQRVGGSQRQQGTRKSQF